MGTTFGYQNFSTGCPREVSPATEPERPLRCGLWGSTPIGCSRAAWLSALSRRHPRVSIYSTRVTSAVACSWPRDLISVSLLPGRGPASAAAAPFSGLPFFCRDPNPQINAFLSTLNAGVAGGRTAVATLLGGSDRLAHGSPQQPRPPWDPAPATPPRAPYYLAVGTAPPGQPTPASPSSRLGLGSLEPGWFNALLHAVR